MCPTWRRKMIVERGEPPPTFLLALEGTDTVVKYLVKF
jgi:hypothetical protein